MKPYIPITVENCAFLPCGKRNFQPRAFYQDGKKHLGFDEYRMRNAKATLRGKHWRLAFVACSFLHLDCFPASLKQSRFPIESSGEACRQQAQSLIETLILYASRQLEQELPAQELF